MGVGGYTLAQQVINSQNVGSTSVSFPDRTYPYYAFKWILGARGDILARTYRGTVIFAGSTTTSYNISPDIVPKWTELRTAFDFTTLATATVDCESETSDSLVYVNINYPRLFGETSSTGDQTVASLESITAKLTNLVKKPWSWNPPGGLFSTRGPCTPRPSFNDGGDFTTQIFGTVEPVFSTLGKSWSNWIWANSNSYVGWRNFSETMITQDSTKWIRDGTFDYGNGIIANNYKWNMEGEITWKDLETVIFNTTNFPTCESYRDWSKWGSNGMGMNGFALPDGIVSTNCGLTTGQSSSKYSHAISLKNTNAYTCTTGSWGWGQWGIEWSIDSYWTLTNQQTAFTFLKDIYNTLDGFSSQSPKAITSGTDRFPGAIKIFIDLGLYYNVDTRTAGQPDTSRAVPLTLKGKSIRDTWLESTQGQEFNSSVGIVKSSDNSSFSFMVAKYTDDLSNIAVISKLLFILQRKFTIPVDFKSLPSNIGSIPNLALKWSLDMYVLNGGIHIAVPPTYIPFFNVLGSAGFTNQTTWHDIDWSSSMGNSLTTDEVVTVCQVVNGASSIPTGYIYGTCGNSSLEKYNNNADTIFQEVTKFSNQFEVVKKSAAGVVSKISTLIGTIKGSNTVFYNILSDAQRKTLTRMQNELPNLQAVFTSASATLNQLNASLFSNTSQLSAAAVSAKTCETQSSVRDILNLNEAVQAAYSKITALFTDIKASFSELQIPIESGVPDISTSLESIQQRLFDLAAGVTPLGNSACLLNPNGCGATGSGSGTGTNPNPTPATTNTTPAKSKSNTMLYVGVIVGVLLVAGLVYWFYFRKPGPEKVYAPAPVYAPAATPTVTQTMTQTATPTVTPTVTPTETQPVTTIVTPTK